MKNNNQAVIKKLTKKILSTDKQRNLFVVLAIVLTSFMIATVFSIGMSYHEMLSIQNQRFEGSLTHMVITAPTGQQIETLQEMSNVRHIGINAHVTYDRGDAENPMLLYLNDVQWREFQAPAFTGIVGSYPIAHNEIALSRHKLSQMGFDEAYIGMKVPITYIAIGTDTEVTAYFTLTLMYTEFLSVASGGMASPPAFVSYEFASYYNRTNLADSSVNILFTNRNRIEEFGDEVLGELSLSENQEYFIVTELFAVGLSETAYIAIVTVVLFLMLVGYLLIYNVMYASVSKDVRFYGLLKAVGTTPKQLRKIVNYQVLYLYLIGLPIGLLSAVLISFLIIPVLYGNMQFGTVISFSPLIYIGGAVFTFITVYLSSYASAKKVAKASPIEALRHIGEPSNVRKKQKSAKGKPLKLAWRNVFRERKRAMMVMTSLFLGLFVFVFMLLTMVDVDHFVNTHYSHDFSLGRGQAEISNELISEITESPYVLETFETTVALTDFNFTESLNDYFDWLVRRSESHHDEPSTREEILGQPLEIILYGIDTADFLALTAETTGIFDVQAFERGEIALMSHALLVDIDEEDPMFESFIGGTRLEMMLEAETIHELELAGFVEFKDMRNIDGVFSFAGSGVATLIVSNEFIREHFPSYSTQWFEFNVADGGDEIIFNQLERHPEADGLAMVSRFEARQMGQQMQMLNTILAVSMSTILGLIGICNFINTIAVGLLTRKREFATLESIGMSKKQVRTILRYEGMIYWMLSITVFLTIGNIVAISLVRLLFAEENVVLVYPIVPVLFICGIIIAVCTIVPELAYRKMSKLSLVDRLRENE